MGKEVPLILLSVTLFFTCCQSAPHIIGGRNATSGEFPYQVSFQVMDDYNETDHECGGAIIDKNHVLTAAHCMIFNVPTIVIYAGFINISTVGQLIRHTVVEAFVHEEFNNTYYFNDIALLKVTPDFDFSNPLIQPIQMRNTPIPEGTTCQVTGWGLLNSSYYAYPIILQELDVPIIAREKCSDIYETVPGMICAGYLEGGRDACGGDSGGPLACAGQLTGIVSSGYGCALPEAPGLYTEVSVYQKWIEEKINK